MTTTPDVATSLMLSSTVAPDQTLAVARFAEESAYDRLWITEDYFRKAAFATAGAVLAATRDLPVGLGIASAYLRHPAALAMEVATLEAMFPGRFAAGVGLGSVPALRATGRMPERAVGSLRGRMRVLRELLAGTPVQWRDEFDRADAVRLEYPATAAPLWAAAESPQMLRLAAREADGLILSALSSPGYLTWVQGQIAAALAARPRPLPVTVFLYTSVHEDEDIARHHAHEFVAARLATGRAGRTLRHSGHWDEVEPLLGLPAEQVRPRLRAEVVEAFVLYGTAQSCRQRLRAYAEAGVDEVALAPIPVGGVLDLAAAMPQLAQLSPAAAR